MIRLKTNLNSQIEKIVEMAKEKGIDESFFFTATFNDYKRQRVIIARLSKELDDRLITESGKPNPCLPAYNKAIESAAKLALSLIEIVYGQTGERVENVIEDKKTCPEFEKLSAKDISKWCKKFDVNPDDYAKPFLYRTLRKRWNFEYGE